LQLLDLNEVGAVFLVPRGSFLVTISLGIVLLAIWLLWSGVYHTLTIAFGVISCFGVALIASRLGLVDREGHPIHLALGLVTYVPWLLWAIVKANIDVAWRILRPTMPISPRLIEVSAGQSSDLGRVIYANSITLTPGTVSVEMDGGKILVHALTKEAADDVESGDMDRRVTKLEGAA
jgi:multicomponent Na+:H+ antiporter subunit E